MTYLAIWLGLLVGVLSTAVGLKLNWSIWRILVVSLIVNQAIIWPVVWAHNA